MGKLEDALIIGFDHTPTDEMRAALKSIEQAIEMDFTHYEVLWQCQNKGPVWDGDVISKSHRSDMLEIGAISKVWVKGEDGFNACTYYGGSLIRILNAIRPEWKSKFTTSNSEEA